MTEIKNSTPAGTLATEIPSKQTRGFDIPIKNTLLEPKHYRAIGESIWLFLWCVDRITKEVIDEKKGGRIGLVLGSLPHHDADIAHSLGCSTKTLRRWRKRLVDHGYLGCLRTPNGHVLWINKSKKWSSAAKSPTIAPPEMRVTGHNRPLTSGANSPRCPVDLPIVSSRVDTDGKCNKTEAVTSVGTQQKEESASHQAAASVPIIEHEIFSFYERFGRPKPLWRKTEREKLADLVEQNDQSQILGALEIYLAQETPYLIKEKHPFSVFAAQFASYRDCAADQESSELEAEFLGDTIDEVEAEIDRESVVVEIAKGPSAGRRQRCHPDVAKLWFQNGRAIPCEQSHKPKVVKVHFRARDYWIEERKAKKYFNAGLIAEVKLNAK